MALRFAVFTMGIGSILISGLIIAWTADLIDGVTVSFWSAVLVGVIVTIVNLIRYDFARLRRARLVLRTRGAARGAADSAPPGPHDQQDRRPRHLLSRDRRSGGAGAAPRDHQRPHAQRCALDAVRFPPHRPLGMRPLVSDQRESGRTAARKQRRHPGLSLVRARHRPPDDFERPGQRRRGRAALDHWRRPARLRRHQPRQS